MDPLRELPCDDGMGEEATTVTGTSTTVEVASHPRGDSAVDSECADLLHGLNNVLVGTLLNTQVIEWKLPSYSRLKRNLHEIERNTQLGGELVKRLMKHLEVAGRDDVTRRHDSDEFSVTGDIMGADVISENLEENSADAMIALLSFRGPRVAEDSTLAADSKKVSHTPV